MNTTLMEQARELLGTIVLIQERTIRRFSGKLDGQSRALCAEVTLAQFRTLRAIHDRQEVTIKELAEALQVSPPSASTMVERLVEMGLLVREQSQTDRREVRVRVSEEGRATLLAHEELILSGISEILEKVGPECAAQWREVYRRIREVIVEERASEQATTQPEEVNG